MSESVSRELRPTLLCLCRALLLTAATLPGCTQQAAVAPEEAKPAEKAPFRDGVFQVGEGELHLHCKGSGSPIVVFDSGSGMDGTVWGGVAADLAPLTRACAYDRMGLGYSSYGKKRPRTSQQMADELFALLQAAEQLPPYVLVAHSAAGLNVRLFAASHPREVAAMVLVDAVGPRHHERFMSLYPPHTSDMVRRNVQRIPDGWDLDTLLESMKQVARAPSLGDTPLVVLSRGQPSVGELGVTPEQASQLFMAWTELQAELPRLSTNSAQITAPSSGHMMIWEANALVVEGIKEAVRVAREGGRVDAARLATFASPAAP
jgi:pimeloyl-ACP methyl ester carboxylesterase